MSKMYVNQFIDAFVCEFIKFALSMKQFYKSQEPAFKLDFHLMDYFKFSLNVFNKRKILY